MWISSGLKGHSEKRETKSPEAAAQDSRDTGRPGPGSWSKVLPAEDTFSHHMVSRKWGLFCAPSAYHEKMDTGYLPASTLSLTTEAVGAAIFLPANSSTSPTYMGPHD